MSRRRNDNKPTAQPRRIGKPRTTPKGGTYQVRAYAGTDSAPFGRVTFRHPDTGRPTSRVPSTGETPDELFERIERALDQQVAIGATAIEESGVVQVRNMEALGKLYIQELQDDGASEAYVIGRECLIRKWIDPVVGDLLVQDWAPQDSKKIIARMGTAGLSKGRIEDLGSTLSGMRQTAHAKRHGGRWLSLDEDPLERVKYTWKSDLQGADRSFVKPKHRPSTDKVQAAIESAYDLNVPHWMPTIISVAAFCALRLGEQLALRAIDIDFENHQLDVSGSWTVARKARTKGARRDRGRKANKNKMRRVAPYRGSQNEPLLVLARKALGLTEDATEDVVIERITAERERRAELAGGEWRDYKENAADESWLFPGHEGLPPTKEAFNDLWHKVRDASGWSTYIPYKNMRHHAALWWYSKGFDWVTIADWDGHDVDTLRKYYVIRSEDATRNARSTLDSL